MSYTRDIKVKWGTRNTLAHPGAQVGRHRSGARIVLLRGVPSSVETTAALIAAQQVVLLRKAHVLEWSEIHPGAILR